MICLKYKWICFLRGVDDISKYSVLPIPSPPPPKKVTELPFLSISSFSSSKLGISCHIRCPNADEICAGLADMIQDLWGGLRLFELAAGQQARYPPALLYMGHWCLGNRTTLRITQQLHPGSIIILTTTTTILILNFFKDVSYQMRRKLCVFFISTASNRSFWCSLLCSPRVNLKKKRFCCLCISQKTWL